MNQISIHSNGHGTATASVSEGPWSPEEIEEINARFEGRPPEELLIWARETFGDGLVMATGFGPSGVVLLDLISRAVRRVRTFYLETELLFDETYKLKKILEKKYKIEIEAVHGGVTVTDQTRRYGDKLWKHDPDRCCHIRKVAPLRKYLSDKSAWITGIRRDQSLVRRNTRLVDWDRANNAVKINPLSGWTEKEIWSYIRLHDLPYNSLHDEDYPSIGCWPCTAKVEGSNDARAGRWLGSSKTECGIHLAEKVVEESS